jgi:hypothetical protein
MARIRTAMGDPMTRVEIETYVPYAADMFLRACGYKAKVSANAVFSGYCLSTLWAGL